MNVFTLYGKQEWRCSQEYYWKSESKPMILNQGQFCLPGNICKCVRTFGVKGRCCQHLVSRDLRSYKWPAVHGAAPQQRTIRPQMSGVLSVRNSDRNKVLRGCWAEWDTTLALALFPELSEWAFRWSHILFPYPQFTDKETEAKRNQVICPRSAVRKRQLLMWPRASQMWLRK